MAKIGIQAFFKQNLLK